MTLAHAEQTDHPSATWCILPWIHLFAGEVGALRPCCMALEDPAMVNRDSQGEPHVIYAEDGIATAWNSDFMRSIRRELLAGQRPDACQRCFREEDLGVASHRQSSNGAFAHHKDAVLRQTEADGHAPIELIRSIDIRLGNRCNLRCRMCSPVSSRALLAEFASYHEVPTDDPRLTRLIGEDWVSKSHFQRTFAACVRHAEKLMFAGGEPLLVPEMEKMLRVVVDQGRAGGIDLEYVTNLTVLPERLFELWAHFRRVSFVVSLDGVGRVGELIRHPLRWDRFDQNARTLDARAASLPGAGLHANVTVQIYNVLHLDAVVDYVATALPHFGRPKLSLLFYPEHLSVRVLSPELKVEATARLRALAGRIRDRCPPQWQGAPMEDLCASINGIIEFINAQDRGDLLPEFQRWTRHLDQTRGESTLAILPELAPLLG